MVDGEARPAVSGTGEEDRYVDEGALDAGGMSTVHRVLDRKLQRRVAMKRLSPALAQRPAEVERFRAEAQRTAQLDHPHIPPVHEVGVDADGRPFFTMKLVEGPTLLDLLRANPGAAGDLSVLFERVQIFLKTCDAVAFAHSRGLVHCDLKPQNLMVGSHGQVYVMDWGISRPMPDGAPARAPGESQVEGTAAYMAPEQANGQSGRIDSRTDVFGLGGVLYRILAGRAPYVGPVDSQLEQARAGRILPPWLVDRDSSRSLGEVAMKAMSPDPDARFASVELLKQAVEGWLRGDVEHATRTFLPGALLMREGDDGDAAYVLTEGRCVVFRMLATGRHVIEELGPGAVVGETALFASQPRSASVEALTPVKATVITRGLLEEEMNRTFWASQLVRALAGRFRSVNARAVEADEKALLQELSEQILLFMLNRAEGRREVPWLSLKMHLCRTLQRTGPDVTSLVSRLPRFDLDLNADLLSLKSG